MTDYLNDPILIITVRLNPAKTEYPFQWTRFRMKNHGTATTSRKSVQPIKYREILSHPIKMLTTLDYTICGLAL
jgi:hypothetical protein